MKVNLLGVKIDDINIEEALNWVEKWIWSPGDKFYIVTPNPEIIVAAQDDPSFKSVLNKADLSIPDGVGLKLSGKVKNTVSGVDLVERLIKLSWEKGFTIGLLGGENGVAEKTKECLEKQYQNISIKFSLSGVKINKEGKQENENKIKIPPLDILFVAFGHIKQEKWIANNLKNIPVKVFMGVGGTFDYISGRVPRAPLSIRKLGFEWLFRLLIEPWRVKRQIALIKYLLMII